MNFVSTSIYNKALRLALKEGLSPGAFAHHPIRADQTGDREHIPMESLWEVYELADQQLEPGFAIRQGRQLVPEDYGTLGLAWKTCWKARDVLERTERFMILVTNHGFIRLEDEKDRTRLYLSRDPHHRGIAMTNEVAFVMISKIIREVTETDIYPTLVSFQHGPAKAILSYEQYFRCPVQFGQENNAMHFKAIDLTTATVKADQSIQEFFIERMEEEAKQIRVNANKLVKDVQELIKEALPSGIPSVQQIGEHLGMSNRTLKRRLTEHGFTFRDLIKNTQEDISYDLLKNSTHPIAEIAFQTGYSEQSAFNRAFKRWTGQSPVEFRKAK